MIVNHPREIKKTSAGVAPIKRREIDMGLRRAIAERVELIRYRLIERAEREARERAIRARRYRFHAKNHVLDRKGGWTWSTEKDALERAVARRREAERMESRREEALSFLPASLSRAVARMSTGGAGDSARKAERTVRSRVRAFVGEFFAEAGPGRSDYERLYPAEKSWDELVREAKEAAKEVERMMMADMEESEGTLHTDAFEAVRRRALEQAPPRTDWPARADEEELSEREREFYESLGARVAPPRVPIEELTVYPDPGPVSVEDIGQRFDLDMGLVPEVAESREPSASPEPAAEVRSETAEASESLDSQGIPDAEAIEHAEPFRESEDSSEASESGESENRIDDPSSPVVEIPSTPALTATIERGPRPRRLPWSSSLFSPRGLAEAGGLAVQPACKGGRVVCPVPIYDTERAAALGAEPKSGGKTSFRAETIAERGAELDELLPLTARSILVPPRLDVAPSSSFASNLDNLLDRSSLAQIKRDALTRTGGRCESCGSAADVEAAERWRFLEPLEGEDGARGLQVLDGFLPLCRKCRSAFRVGALMSVAKRRPEVVPSDALAGLARICRWSQDEARAYANGAFLLWSERGRLEWTMDLSILSSYEPLRIGRGWRGEGGCSFTRRMLAGKPGLSARASIVGCSCETGKGVAPAEPIPKWAENLAERGYGTT